MNKFGTATPYIASYVILKRDNKVLFVKRSNTGWMDDKYGLPAGKVEVDESFIEGAVREAKEEVGVDIEVADLKHILTIHRKAEGDATYWVDVFFEADKWQHEPHNAEPEVHSEVAWLDIDNLPPSLIPMLTFAFEQLKQGINYAEYGWN